MGKIKHVFGNHLRLAIPLQKLVRTLEDGQVVERAEDFFPNPDFPVSVVLTGYNRQKTYEAAMEGNVATIEDDGTLPVGRYQVEVIAHDAEGRQVRYMQRDAVAIVNATADAGIEPGIEFDAEAQMLEGAVFIYAEGSQPAPVPVKRQVERLVVVGKSIPFWVGHNDPYREIYYAFPVRDRYKGGGYSVHGACVSFRFRLAELREFAAGEITLPSAPNNLFSVTAHFRQNPKGYFVAHVKADSIEDLLDEVDGMGEEFRSAMNSCLEAFAESKAYVNVMTLTYEVEVPELNGWAIAVYNRDEYGYVVSVENLGFNLNDSYLRSASPNILWAGNRPTLLTRPHVEEAQGAPFSFQGASPQEKRDFYSSGQVFFEQHLKYHRLGHRGCFHGLGVRIYKGGIVRVLFKDNEEKDFAWCRFNKLGEEQHPKFKAGRYLLRCFYRNVEADEGTEVLLMRRYVRWTDEEGVLKSHVRHAVKVSNLTYHQYNEY